eukprot:scaffold116562_cov22-Tisochrysis_lutea.AAC.2
MSTTSSLVPPPMPSLAAVADDQATAGRGLRARVLQEARYRQHVLQLIAPPRKVWQHVFQLTMHVLQLVVRDAAACLPKHMLPAPPCQGAAGKRSRHWGYHAGIGVQYRPFVMMMYDCPGIRSRNKHTGQLVFDPLIPCVLSHWAHASTHTAVLA